MNSPDLSDDLRRFIHSIRSIPQLEAILLLRQYPSHIWQAGELAQRLYVKENIGEDLLADLVAAGVAEPAKESGYCFKPSSQELSGLIDQLALYYAHHLIEVTHMIHSKANQSNRVQQFADAFKFKPKNN